MKKTFEKQELLIKEILTTIQVNGLSIKPKAAEKKIKKLVKEIYKIEAKHQKKVKEEALKTNEKAFTRGKAVVAERKPKVITGKTAEKKMEKSPVTVKKVVKRVLKQKP
jgi:hypothetical protein